MQYNRFSEKAAGLIGLLVLLEAGKGEKEGVFLWNRLLFFLCVAVDERKIHVSLCFLARFSPCFASCTYPILQNSPFYLGKFGEKPVLPAWM